MDKKVTLKWYYHDNSDCIFVDKERGDLGGGEILEIGDYKEGTIKELRSLLKGSRLFLLDCKELEKLVDNDIEQY